MKEQSYDDLLNIQTTGDQMGFHKSFHYHRYEATPYSALEELFKNYQLDRNDHLVDFGCGKGRLSFYIHHIFEANVVGIEMDETYYLEALHNRDSYLHKHNKGKNKIHFHHCLAQDYKISPLDNRFYFFNPFSIQIFMTIINNIQISLETSYRDIELILYYPSEDYTYYLESQTPFELIEEFQLTEAYENNPFEKFLIYRLAY